MYLQVIKRCHASQKNLQENAEKISDRPRWNSKINSGALSFVQIFGREPGWWLFGTNV